MHAAGSKFERGEDMVRQNNGRVNKMRREVDCVPAKRRAPGKLIVYLRSKEPDSA